MNYNLIRNGNFQSVTTSGTGNVSLSWTQLESLMDGTTTSGGVSLTTSGVLYMDADLSQRIKIDGIRLYASDLTKSANIKFYYKNETNDSYTLLSTSVGSYYYTTISDPSAPRFILATISGVDMIIYEHAVMNSDYIVAFGSDGSQYAKYLEDTPVGSEGTAETIPLFNNSSLLTGMAADAYTVVDYTGSVADEYVKISSSQNGTYYGIEDGALIEDDNLNSEIRWSMGSFSNTEISVDKVVLTTPTVGTYTTPIFKLDNQYNSSYFITDGTAVSGTGSISYDADVYNGTIRVKSSNTEPIPISEAYLVLASRYMNPTKYIPHQSSYATWFSYDGGTNTYGLAMAVDRRTGYVAMTYIYSSVNTIRVYLRMYNRSGGVVITGLWSDSNYTYSGDVNLEFDKSGGLWSYSSSYNPAAPGTPRTLKHINSTLSALASISDSFIDFLYDFAVELDGDGVWYTDKVDDLVIHKNTSGTTIHSIALETPRAICGTLDNGCWVVDNKDGDTATAYRYNSSGGVVKTVTLPETPAYNKAQANRMTTDYENGFWYRHDSYVYHVTSGGSVDVGPIFINNANRLRGAHNGCFVISTTNDVLYFIDKAVGDITRSTSIASNAQSVFGVFPFNNDSVVEFQNTSNWIPASYDPVWGTGGTAEWQEVRKDGYFLSKARYHRTEVTLRGDATLEKILLPPAIKTEDIQPQQSQNIYIKTDIPEGADITDYETRIKTWFGVQE